MERFDIRGSDWGLQRRQDGLGAFCWAAQVEECQKQCNRDRLIAIIVAVACAVLAAYLSVGKHDPQPVQQAAVSEEEYQEVVQKEQQAQAEKATLRKQLADEHARRLLADKRIKSLNMTVAQHQQQLKDLQVSVPTQPIIMEAIRKEAATEKGLRQAVARSFGNDIAAHIQIIGE